MKALRKILRVGLLALLLILGLSYLLFAQSDTTEKENKQYEELVQFQINHTIEQENEGQSFSEVMVGIGMQAPDDIFLSQLVLTTDPARLKEAVVHEPIDESLPVGDFEFVEYDDLFAGSDEGNGSGFGVGISSGHCPPGGRY